MVHRPVDSRLLTNVLSQEKEYSKQLNSLLDQSHASVASYSAYASASSPPTSSVILAVATSLASADEALRRYAAAVDECSAHLKGLKELEDEVGNILRDREILVTRLIKASKTSKPTAANRLSFTLHSTSSLTSLQSSGSSPLNLPGAYPPSTSSFSSTSPAPSPLHTSQKLSAAQSELQACETHLALKERELAAMRAGAFRDGMSVRFRALVECGWVWGEMGKEALRMLDELGAVMNGGVQQHHTGGSLLLSQPPTTTTTTYTNGTVKPLPDRPSRPSSDLSSLAPSQSASQIEPNGATSSNYSNSQQGHGVNSVSDHTGPGTGISIPPAHAITDSSGHFYPYAPTPSTSSVTATSAPAGVEAVTSPRHVLQHRITEEELATIASVSEHDHAHKEDSTSQPPPPAPEKSEPRPAKYPQQQAAEEEEGVLITNDDNSSINEPTPPTESLQVIENPRFSTPSNSSKISLNRSHKPPPLPPTQSPPLPTTLQPAKDKSATYAPLGSPNKPHRRFTLTTQNRRESYDSRNSDTTAPKSGFFGSLGRSLFGGKKKDKDKESGSEVSTSKPGDVPPTSPSKPTINLNSSPSTPRTPQGGRIYAAEDTSDDDSDGGEDEHHQRGRKGLRGIFSHSNGSGAGGSKKWETRTDKNLNALQKGGRGHRRGGSVDQVNLVQNTPHAHMQQRGANANLYEVVAGAGLPNSASNASKASIPGGTHRKRVASDVGYRTPPRLDSQALLGGSPSGSPTTPTSPGRPGMRRSPSESSAGAKPGGRKLKKRSPSSNAAQSPTLATIQSGKSEEGHGEPVPIHALTPPQPQPQPQPHVTVTAPTPPSAGEKGKGKAREPGVGGSDVGAGGGVKRTKSARSTGAASGKRSSSVPPAMPVNSSASTSTVTITPVKSTTATTAKTATTANAPNQITTHHAGGAVLVTGLPSATGTSSTLTSTHPSLMGGGTAGAGSGVGGANLSRNSSLMSAMSAPPLLLVPAPGSGTAAHGGATKRASSATRHGRGGGSGSALGVAGERAVPAGPRPVSQGHVKRSASVNVPSTTTSNQHHHLQQQLRQQHAQPFIIPTAPPPASVSVGTLAASKPVAGPPSTSTGMEVKAPRRVDREELEREVASGSSVSASGQHHHHHAGGSHGGGVTRGRSLERVADGESARSQRQVVPPAHQQPAAKKQTSIEVPSAPKSIFEAQTPTAGPSGHQSQEQHLSTHAASVSAPGPSRPSDIAAGSSTPLAVAAPQPRPAVSPSSPVFPPVPVVQPIPSQPIRTAPPQQFGNTLSPSPSLHRQHDKSPLRSALKNSTSGSASGNSRSPSPEKVPSHRSQSPLKSALKNSSTTNVHLVVGQVAGPSRTPSPLAFGSSAAPPEPTRSPPPTNTVAVSPATVPIPRPATTSPVPADDDRRMSIASAATTDDDAEYETADEDESLSDREDPTDSTPTHTTTQLPAPIPPPATQVAVPNGHAVQAPPTVLSTQTSDEGSGVGTATTSGASGEGTGQVKRRKSVRVSLQPTFTPTPPAIEYSDEEEEAEARAPWGGRDRKTGREDERSGAGGENGKDGKSKGKKKDTKELPTPDMWEDSSEEDVEYSRARKLLSRLGKKKDHR